MARASGKQNVQSRNFGYHSERRVCRRQCVVRLAKFERYLRTYVNTKRRNHHEHDHGKVEKHDRRLAPRVGPKPAHAREESADEQPHSHGNLKEQNEVGV